MSQCLVGGDNFSGGEVLFHEVGYEHVDTVDSYLSCDFVVLLGKCQSKTVPEFAPPLSPASFRFPKDTKQLGTSHRHSILARFTQNLHRIESVGKSMRKVKIDDQTDAA